MKQFYFRSLLLLALSLTFVYNVSGTGISGSGTDDDPYKITSYEDLKLVVNDLTAVYRLVADIDATASKDENSGAGWSPIGTASGASSFTGKFYGGGHVISNLFINSANSNVGLFGYITSATIDSIGVINANVTGSQCVGVLIGAAYGGTISYSYSTGTVTSSYALSRAGGLIGYNLQSEISYSYSTAKVTGLAAIGGFVGQSSKGTISRSYSTGNVSGSTLVGGFVGLLNGTVNNSYSLGNVTGNTSTSANIGGFVGQVVSSTMSVISNIENSYSNGKIIVTSAATTIGGFAGGNQALTAYPTVVTSSYWNTDSSGYTTSVLATGKTAVLLKAQTTFTNWDFTNTWKIDASLNGGYPYLAWQKFDHTTAVNDLNNPSALAVINVYPNPAREFETVTIELKNISTTELNGATLNLYTFQGALVLKSANVKFLNEVKLQAGSYIGNVVTSSGQKHLFKVIIVK